MEQYYVFGVAVNNCKIISKGDIVGGISGWVGLNGSHGPQYCYVYNSKIEGNSKVGGVIGEIRDGPVRNCMVDAQVIATSHTAGGVVGYMNNTNMTSAANIIQIYNNGVTASIITAPTKVGGLIGDISKDLIREPEYFYNNYVHAYLESENSENISMGIGGSKENNEAITNTYIYKYSQINGEYMNENIDTYTEEQYVYGEELKEETTYINKFDWKTEFTYTPLQNNKYPVPIYVENSEIEYISLPIDPEIVDINSLGNDENEKDNTTEVTDENNILTQNIEALPEVTVYPISINEINIDFSNISENTSFTYYINEEEIETINLTEKTYTFEYNFKDQLEIVVTNEIDEETITINPSDIRSEISLIGDNYAYLIGNNLYINGELQSGEYVNVYSGYALNSYGQVLDILSKEVNNDEIVETSLEKSAKPLYTYEYNGKSIEVYGTYSKVNENVKLQIYNVRSGKLSALSNSLDMKIDNYIVDSYNEKEYQTILTNNGEIVDLKEQLQYPSNFLNRNVKQIVQNGHHDNTEMMVLYNTGKVLVFDYVNGNVIYETEEKADSGLANYITESINSIWNDYESKQTEYLRSRELIAKLVEMPIEEALNEVESNEINSSTSNIETSINISNTNDTSTSTNVNTDSYITVYNGDTGEYEVYSESEILEGSEEMPVSETEKIKENGLESIYNYEREEETGIKLNGAIIVIGIIAVAIISLVILRKLVYRNNKKKNNK